MRKSARELGGNCWLSSSTICRRVSAGKSCDSYNYTGFDGFIWVLFDFNWLNPLLQTWMWVIGPMIIYLCERLLRFIRYMQPVSYRKVSLHEVHCSSEPQYSCSVMTNCFHSCILDCNPPIQGVGTTAGEAWIQDGSRSVCVPQLSSHLSAWVASIYHDISPGRGLL